MHPWSGRKAQTLNGGSGSHSEGQARSTDELVISDNQNEEARVQMRNGKFRAVKMKYFFTQQAIGRETYFKTWYRLII